MLELANLPFMSSGHKIITLCNRHQGLCFVIFYYTYQYNKPLIISRKKGIN